MIPFPMAAIASSRTPKWRFLPDGSSAEKSPASFIAVLLEGARSAEPPIRFGSLSFNRLIIFPDRDRVASAFSLGIHKDASFNSSSFAGAL